MNILFGITCSVLLFVMVAIRHKVYHLMCIDEYPYYDEFQKNNLEQNIRRAFPRLYRRWVSAGARHIVP